MSDVVQVDEPVIGSTELHWAPGTGVPMVGQECRCVGACVGHQLTSTSD